MKNSAYINDQYRSTGKNQNIQPTFLSKLDESDYFDIDLFLELTKDIEDLVYNPNSVILVSDLERIIITIYYCNQSKLDQFEFSNNVEIIKWEEENDILFTNILMDSCSKFYLKGLKSS